MFGGHSVFLRIGDDGCGEAQTFYAQAAQLKIASYFNLGTNPGNWRMWLATKGPILTRLDVDATWDNAAATKGKLDAYRSDTVRGGVH